MRVLLVSIIFFLWFTISAQSQLRSKEIVLTGTIQGLYPITKKGQVEVPCYFYNPKSERYQNYIPLFAAPDSFFFRFNFDKPKLIHILFIPVYLVPGDSVHVDFIYKEDDEQKISSSSFTNVYSKQGNQGNIGYYSLFQNKLNYFRFQFQPKKNQNPRHRLDSLYKELTLSTEEYFRHHHASADFKRNVENDLLLLKVSKEFDIVQGDSVKIFQKLNEWKYLFGPKVPNTIDYFSLVGSIQEAFVSIYPNDPDKSLEQMKKYLDEETYTYASLILSNILRQSIPVINNPFSGKIALDAIQSSKDTDLVSFAQSVLSKLAVQKNSSNVFAKLKVRDSDGTIYTVEEILSRTNSKLKYVDLWASWCGPCIAEISNSKKVPEKFGEDIIHTIFISVDEDTIAWKNAFGKLRMKSQNSYCILDKKNVEMLTDALLLKAIPRYVLLDSQNSIQLLSAPGPRMLTQELLSRFSEKKSATTSALPPPPPPSKRKN